MFSYRHAFHAGNHADVLKHLVLLRLLGHLQSKEAAFWAVDTHAGAGWYPLDSDESRKRREFDAGIGALWDTQPSAPALVEYLNAVRAFNPDDKLTRYPGSPRLMLDALRPKDRLRLYELHTTEIRVLRERMSGSRQIRIDHADGFDALRGVLPPPPRRALVLIDPSYEDKNDYHRVRQTLRDAYERFPTGVYAVWYPQVARHESDRFAETLKQMTRQDWLHVRLNVAARPRDGFGLFGSGMFVVNPPWTLPAALDAAMPELLDLLAVGRAGSWHMERKIR